MHIASEKNVNKVYASIGDLQFCGALGYFYRIPFFLDICSACLIFASDSDEDMYIRKSLLLKFHNMYARDLHLQKRK